MMSNIVQKDAGIIVMHNIFWFRNNFRLSANEPLLQCLKNSTHLSFIHIINPKINELNLEGNKKNLFYLRALIELEKKLQKKDHKLYIFHGEPREVFAQIMMGNKINEVYAEKIYAPYELEEENIGIHTNFIWDSTLINESDLPFAINELPDTFTTFRKQIENNKIRVFSEDTPKFPSKTNLKEVKEFKLPLLPEFMFTGSVDFLNDYPISEEGANRYVDDYFSTQKPSTYKSTRNELSGINFSTKFSVWLSLGFISVKQVFNKLKEYESLNGENESTYWIYFELLWRDYFRFLHIKYNKQLYLKNGLGRNLQRINYSNENIALINSANTNSTFINAAINELKKSGFLSNRMRQILASFIVNEMNIDWRWGADFFQKFLIDFDIYSNQGNWIYIAGFGTDPRGGRKFNIVKQKKMYDPNNQYENKWNENT